MCIWYFSKKFHKDNTAYALKGRRDNNLNPTTIQMCFMVQTRRWHNLPLVKPVLRVKTMRSLKSKRIICLEAWMWSRNAMARTKTHLRECLQKYLKLRCSQLLHVQIILALSQSPDNRWLLTGTGGDGNLCLCSMMFSTGIRCDVPPLSPGASFIKVANAQTKTYATL